MRYVYVFHSCDPDFIVGVPDEVDDIDQFLNNVLYGAEGWTESERTIEDLIEKWDGTSLDP